MNAGSIAVFGENVAIWRSDLSLRDSVNFDWYEKQNYSDGDVRGYAVWSDSDFVVQQAARHGGLLDSAARCVVFSGIDWESRFRGFALSGMTSFSEQCCVTEIRGDGGYEPWRSVRLSDLTARMDHDWVLDVVMNGGLRSVFQPIWSLESNSVFGFEALARGERGGILASGYELVEASRALGALEIFDYRARLTAMRGAEGNLSGDEKLFVNILPSLSDRVDRDFSETWAAIDAHGLRPDQIVFEVVESEALPSMEQLARVVGHVRSRGALVALDDFGAGHSTVSILEQLRPDIVKFDRLLLNGALCGEKRKLLSAMVEFAHAFGIKTVAEGVESLDQLAMVGECGFDFAQGWLIGRPNEAFVRPQVLVELN